MANTTQSDDSQNVTGVGENIFHQCYWSYVVLSPSKSYVTNMIASSVVNAILSILGTFLNTLVIFVLWKLKNLRRRVAFFLIMILSLSDLGVAIVVSPVFIMHLVSELSGDPKCIYRDCFHLSAFVFSGMSVVTLFAINTERFIAIFYPIRHLNWVTKRRCVSAMAVFWVFPLILVFANVLALNSVVAAIMLLLVAGTVLMYLSIFFHARKVIRRRSLQPREASGSSMSTNYSIEQTSDEVSFRKDLKLAKTCFFIVLTLLICYLPLTAVFAMWERKTISFDVKIHAHLWGATILRLNASMNCLVLFWANKGIRDKATAKLFQFTSCSGTSGTG